MAGTTPQKKKLVYYRLTNILPNEILIWLVVSTPLKNISQLGWLFPIYGNMKNVPNHQPVVDVSENSLKIRCPKIPWLITILQGPASLSCLSLSHVMDYG